MIRAMTLGVMILIVFVFTSGKANGQTVLAPQEAARIVQLQDLKVTPSLVSGVVVNNSPHVIREIQVLIKYHWLWANEFKPGLDSPGRVFALKVDKELKPGESTAFRFTPDPPLPQRQDGQYDPEVGVASFTIVSSDATTAR